MLKIFNYIILHSAQAKTEPNIEQNRATVGNDVANDAIERVRKERKQKKEENSNEGGTEGNVQEKTKRRRTTKTA